MVHELISRIGSDLCILPGEVVAEKQAKEEICAMLLIFFALFAIMNDNY
jgi:hypothetical protein